MTKQSSIVRADPFELAIETVIHDTRVPRHLRTALAAYRSQRANPNNHGISVVSPRSKSPSKTCQPADGCRFCTSLAQKIDIQMWIDVESLDWFLQLNGHLHERITLETVEALIDFAFVASVRSILKTFSPQQQ
jgi:hypothetical protein